MFLSMWTLLSSESLEVVLLWEVSHTAQTQHTLPGVPFSTGHPMPQPHSSSAQPLSAFPGKMKPYSKYPELNLVCPTPHESLWHKYWHLIPVLSSNHGAVPMTQGISEQQCNPNWQLLHPFDYFHSNIWPGKEDAGACQCTSSHPGTSQWVPSPDYPPAPTAGTIPTAASRPPCPQQQRPPSCTNSFLPGPTYNFWAPTPPTQCATIPEQGKQN